MDIMCQANAKYKKFVSYENGKKVLYMKLLKALYGCIQSALLWYKTFKLCLEDESYKLNNCDPCVANKEVNGK